MEYPCIICTINNQTIEELCGECIDIMLENSTTEELIIYTDSDYDETDNYSDYDIEDYQKEPIPDL